MTVSRFFSLDKMESMAIERYRLFGKMTLNSCDGGWRLLAPSGVGLIKGWLAADNTLVKISCMIIVALV